MNSKIGKFAEGKQSMPEKSLFSWLLA